MAYRIFHEMRLDLAEISLDGEGDYESAWLKVADSDIWLGFEKRLYDETRMDEAEA